MRNLVLLFLLLPGCATLDWQPPTTLKMGTYSYMTTVDVVPGYIISDEGDEVCGQITYHNEYFYHIEISNKKKCTPYRTWAHEGDHLIRDKIGWDTKQTHFFYGKN